MISIQAYANRNGLTRPELFLGVATYRQAAFVDDEMFKSAAEHARRTGRPIWIADVLDLLRKTDPRRLERAMDRLDKADVEILDCLQDRLWSDFSAVERRALIRDAITRKLASSARKEIAKDPHASVVSNGLRGAGANRKKAIRNANALEETVEAFRSSLPPGTSLTPSTLMHHLNTQGIKPPRAERWSINGCKNLLRRLEEKSRQEPHPDDGK